MMVMRYTDWHRKFLSILIQYLFWLFLYKLMNCNYTDQYVSRDQKNKLSEKKVVCLNRVHYQQKHLVPILFLQNSFMYSSPSLIGLPYLPRKCGHIRGVAFVEREK